MRQNHLRGETLTSSDVAEILGISKDTVYRWLRQGKVPEPLRNPTNAYRVFTQRDLDLMSQLVRRKKRGTRND
jgi:DNA-binding transcriptional MerR regulator